MTPVEFIGVSSDPARAVAAGGSGLYEFWTAGDEKVYLHDTLLRSVGFFPGATPSLRFVFEYDADWTPSELQDRPFVIFEFDDVRELEWQEDAESREAVAGGDEVAAAAGQVSLFDWDGVDWFDVHTLLVRLSFRAARVAVRVTSKGDG